MALVIREIKSDAELLEVARLRYDVTVGEMMLTMTHANHKARTVLEPLDHIGHVIGAWIDGNLVGTVRVNLLREGDIGFYFDAYGIGLLPNDVDPSTVSITTRLAVSQRYRRDPTNRIGYRLALHAYSFFLQQKVTHDVIDSRPSLVKFFSKLGYTTHIPAITHPEFGHVVVQSLSCWDELRLATISSPFLEILNSAMAQATH